MSTWLPCRARMPSVSLSLGTAGACSEQIRAGGSVAMVEPCCRPREASPAWAPSSYPPCLLTRHAARRALKHALLAVLQLAGHILEHAWGHLHAWKGRVGSSHVLCSGWCAQRCAGSGGVYRLFTQRQRRGCVCRRARRCRGARTGGVVHVRRGGLAHFIQHAGVQLALHGIVCCGALWRTRGACMCGAEWCRRAALCRARGEAAPVPLLQRHPPARPASPVA